MIRPRLVAYLALPLSRSPHLFKWRINDSRRRSRESRSPVSSSPRSLYTFELSQSIRSVIRFHDDAAASLRRRSHAWPAILRYDRRAIKKSGAPNGEQGSISPSGGRLFYTGRGQIRPQRERRVDNIHTRAR